MGDTENTFSELLRLLKIQEEIIDLFITTGKDQLKALRSNNLAELNKTVCEQQSLGIRMEKTEQQRLLLRDSLERTLSIESGATANSLIPYAPGTIQPGLEKTLKCLNTKIKELKEINSLNSCLIKNTLMLNDRLLNMINPNKSITYDPKGGFNNKREKVSVLNRSI